MMFAIFAPSASVGVTEDRADCRVIVQGRHRTRRVPFGARKDRITLDDGLLLAVGREPMLGHVPRAATVSLTFTRLEGHDIVSVDRAHGHTDLATPKIVIVAKVATCEQAFDFTPKVGRWYMSASLRGITASIAACPRAGSARDLYMRAKGLELACETFEQLRNSSLTPSGRGDTLSEADTRRLIAARAMIEDRAHESLTLDGIARACGLNRSSLSRGFRVLFGTTVATLIAEMRLQRAKNLLLTTDLSVATVGFHSGYRNNASFARAFVRHHGVSPLAARATAGR